METLSDREPHGIPYSVGDGAARKGPVLTGTRRGV